MENPSRRDVLAGAFACWQIRSAGPIHLPARVRVAMVGFEGHAGEILDILPLLPEVRVTAICDSDTAILESEGRKPELSKAARYTDYRQMLGQEQFDVAAVCNDNGARAAAILDCLAHGAHVIAEKPLALRREDLEAIRAAAREAANAWASSCR